VGLISGVGSGHRRSSAGAGRLLAGIALAAVSSGCATSVNSLSKSEIATINIQSVDVRYVPNAHIWWGTAEREYAAKVGAPQHDKPQDKKGKKTEDKTEGKDLPGERDGDAYRDLMSTPAAQAYVRDKLTGMIKAHLQHRVLPLFQGTRAVRLEIEVHSFHIPSPLQRIALGGAPTLMTVTVLKDAATGKELAKLDKGNAGMAFGGVLGVAVDQAMPDLEQRVLENYMDNILAWLTVA
jgi:hypothetical protein